jgi:hypothetical protein
MGYCKSGKKHEGKEEEEGEENIGSETERRGMGWRLAGVSARPIGRL